MPTQIPGTNNFIVEIGDSSIDPQKPPLVNALVNILGAIQQEEYPNSGDEIVITEESRDVSLNIKSDATLDLLTIKFPINGRIAQKFHISFMSDVTELIQTNIWSGHVNSVMAGEVFSFIRQDTNQIQRVSA